MAVPLVAAGFGLGVPRAAAPDDARPRRTPISPRQEFLLGLRQLSECMDNRPESSDEALAARVRRIGISVADASDRPHVPWRFRVFDGGPLVVVRGSPGGQVCISRRAAELFDDDELAFVLGHEIAHVALRHRIVQISLEELLREDPETGSPAIRTLVDTWAREDEPEADRYGALYAVRAGYRYSAAAGALRELENRYGGSLEDATHPPPAERIAALEAFRSTLERSVEFFRLGVDALRAGRLADAETYLVGFVSEFPRSVAGHVDLGMVYLARVRARSGTPLGLSEVLPLIGEADVAIRGSFEGEDLELADRHFARALELDGEAPLALAGAALVALRRGALREARSHIERAADLRPDDAELLLCAGNVAFVERDFAEARRRYEAALATRPGWSAARHNLALSLEQLGEPDAARAVWMQLVGDGRYGTVAARHVALLSRPAARD
ncbi:MAG: hypothetical protein D6738_13660 [Acidobacteria bacterium]|nr:MAG: hypothetical protein D6738_13660 [Acidobacteriota bacterium]